MKLTKDEQEWLLGILPAMSGKFRLGLLFDRQPKIRKILDEMNTTWEQFCTLYDELDKTAWMAFDALTVDERERFIDWKLCRRFGVEKQMRERFIA